MPTPVWTDNVPIIPSATLARGSVARGVIDLTEKVAAYIFIRIGRTGTAVIAPVIDVSVRRTLNADAIAYGGNVFFGNSGSIAAGSTTVASDSAAGQNVLTLASGAGFLAGDRILIAPGTAREEWGKVSKVAAAVITLDRPLTFTHTAGQADPVTSKADELDPIWVVGGSFTEVVIDYGPQSTGDSVRVEASAQTFDE